jgi:hypothetical protein
MRTKTKILAFSFDRPKWAQHRPKEEKDWVPAIQAEALVRGEGDRFQGEFTKTKVESPLD